MGFEQPERIHAIFTLRDLIRKWWRAELSITTPDGAVSDWAQKQITPPPNDFCRLSLFSGEGFSRCAASVKELHDLTRGAGTKVHECHLGFVMIGAPIIVDGEHRGTLFVQGFSRPKAPRRDDLPAKIATLMSPGATDLERAVDRLPMLDSAALDRLKDLLELGALQIASAEEAKRRVSRSLHAKAPRGGPLDAPRMIGTSEALRQVLERVEKLAHSDASVLISGESGTGKELVARSIHFSGSRRDKPFVVQNCSALNDNLLESALFGHERGAFTDAVVRQRGLFEAADTGTLFLDEIAEMSLALQTKLLRVLQEGSFTPVGGSEVTQVDVRVIAATHRDLAQMVAQKTFREDLFYRVNVVQIHVPALRERPDDVPLLIAHFMARLRRPNDVAHRLSARALQLLAAYRWPGNIRELENEVERLLVLGGHEEVIGEQLLSSRISGPAERAGTPHAFAGHLLPQPLPARMNDAIDLLEKTMLDEGLKRTEGNKSLLARELGISRSNLLLKLKKHELVYGPPTE